jgi:hypothetical protein
MSSNLFQFEIENVKNNMVKTEEASVCVVALIPFPSSENNFLTGHRDSALFIFVRFSIPGSDFLTD